MNRSLLTFLGLGALVLGGSAFASTGSLWTGPGSREQGIVADQRAARVGDILTIIIAEAASQSTSQNKQTSKESSVDASISQFLFPSSVSDFGTHNGSMPGTTFGGSSSFKGGGQVSNSQSVTARTAVLVTDILPNGNFVIAGARRLSFSGETQHVILHGLVRPSDISANNTVLSTNIADAHLEFIAEGSLKESQKRGWLTRIYDLLRPL